MSAPATLQAFDAPHPRVDDALARVGLVVIGRNEGRRLARCLASVQGVARRVYVDSGSTDQSIALAERLGWTVVPLTRPPPFTAARARNAGFARLLALDPTVEFVQMVDGDCEVQPGWLERALAAMQAHAELAAVFGRNRERHPQRSIYNALCDDEWNVPLGEATGCGGNALFRVSALQQVKLYNASMIAGEDTELAMRLRKAGWRLLHVNVEMTLHDADMTHFRQWWIRTRRSGHAYGEMAYLHPDARAPDWPRTVRSIQVWGGVLPALLLVAVWLALADSARWWALVVALLVPWPLKMLQLARRKRQRGLATRVALASGILLMLGKIPQFIGLIGFHRDRICGRPSQLIEHR